MRVAIFSDVHGNLTAFEAVLADIRLMAPDAVIHAGDLADTGPDPAAIIDRIRDLRWPGVLGNTDELLFRPDSLAEFAMQLPALSATFAKVEEMACVTREALGPHRLDWLRDLPRTIHEGGALILHARPDTVWRAPGPEARGADFESAYGSIAERVIVYGHLHLPFIRKIGAATFVNSGSVGLPYDGDPRASYAILDDGVPSIRRVEYDIDKEVRARMSSRMPHQDWVVRMLQSAAAQAP